MPPVSEPETERPRSRTHDQPHVTAPPADRLHITVRGDRAVYSFPSMRAHAYEHELERCDTTGTPREVGQRLCTMLFGAPDVRYHVLGRGEFEVSAASSSPWRLRLDLDADAADLPWEHLWTETESLAAAGWTIERGPKKDEYAEVGLPSPFHLVLFSPRSAGLADDDETAGLARSLMERLVTKNGAQYFHLAHTINDLAKALPDDHDVVLWIRSRVIRDNLVADGAAGGQVSEPVSALAQLIKPRHRLVIFEQPSTWAPATPACIVTLPRLDDGSAARARAILDFIARLADDGLDPVLAAANGRHLSPAHAALRVSSRYATWQTARAVSEVDARRIDLELDRTQAKLKAADCAKDLLEKRDQFVLTLFGMGDKAQPMDEFGEQIYVALQRALSPTYLVHCIQVDLPAPIADSEVRQSLLDALQFEGELRPALEQKFKAYRGNQPERMLLLLDWRVVGSAASRELDPADIDTWLRFHHALAAQLKGSDDRVASLLTFHIDREGQALKETFEALTNLTHDGADAIAYADAVMSRALPPAAQVEVDDIRKILEDRRCSRCPREDAALVARGMRHEYAGDFHKVRTALRSALQYPAEYHGWRRKGEAVPAPKKVARF